MKRRKYIETVFLVFIAFLLLLISACHSLPKSQFVRKEVVVNAPFWVVQEAVVQAMAEKNILIKKQETSTTATISGNLLVDVEQYADCGRYYGKKVKGYGDMDFIILVQMIDRNNSGIRITSSVAITEAGTMIVPERRLTCTSNGRMEEELLEAVMQEMREKS
ncbi:MAG: hypothetical protein ACUZ77_12040 [Candidatus Brocadiales bacterium]